MILLNKQVKKDKALIQKSKPKDKKSRKIATAETVYNTFEDVCIESNDAIGSDVFEENIDEVACSQCGESLSMLRSV